MPPPSRTASDHLGAFLTQTVHRAKAGLAVCAVGWTTLAYWVAFEHPERLGVARYVGALALVVATAASSVVWWIARSWQRWLLVVLTELMPALTAGGPRTDTPDGDAGRVLAAVTYPRR